MAQQKEIEEEAEEQNPKNAFAFAAIAEEERNKQEEEDNLDDFGGFSETQSQFGGCEVSSIFR